MDSIAQQLWRLPASRLKDPRYYQIAVLSSLVIFGVVALDFGIRGVNAALIVMTALSVQWLGTRLANLPRFDPLSALITSLSLTLLFRTDLAMLAVLAAAVAIGSKFLIRVNGKHIFNPANVAIVTLMLGSDHAWISTGQWGNAAIGALALACLGFIVLTRARRSETTVTFLLAYGALMFGRALWLGDPLAIPMHQMQNGALLIFAFFMISDPKTTPDARAGRILYGSVVALVTYFIQFVLYEPGAPILALIVCAPLVPIIDSVLRGRIYRWDFNRELPKGVFQ
ncbi:MAG: RnfABCDGE type electron transport complex subunit D [Gammaproteobacteria bacterium]|nr:RnfABCDGE type electron transport complex subunit D [Gammaproteobacteria bacterium]